MSKEFDVIYLDPMYPSLNKKNKKSKFIIDWERGELLVYER